jgi:hypothetical protein
MELTRVEPLKRLHSDGRLLTMPANIIQEWKWMAVENTLAYYDMRTITAVISFTVQAPGFFANEVRLLAF